MRVLLLTDIHGEAEKLEKIIEREEYDALLCAGDLSDANEYSQYEENLYDVLEAFEDGGEMSKAVPGNMDREEECVRALIDHRMNIHKKIASFEEFDVVGFGGGQTPFDTYFEPSGDEIYQALDTLYGRMKSDRKFAVIHQPPSDCELDVIEDEHVGSEEVRGLIEEKEFSFVLTGHIHESYGVDHIGDTKVVNPGAVADGRYGVLEVDGELELELKEIS
ncbi:MAG: metallophosphoesterase [Candidatus Nanohalobium sp.]